MADFDHLKQDNEILRHENSRLHAALEDIRAKLSEPEEVIRAIRHGEIDALVIQEGGQEEIYSLQRFDSVYRAIVEECFPYGVWLAKPDGELLYVTPSFLELFETDLGEMREKGQFHFLPPERRDELERDWKAARETGHVYSAEYTITLGDGSERAIWTQGLLARTHDGLPHWVGVNIDVTERQKIEEELRQQTDALRISEAQFRLMADTMPQIVWVTRPDGYHEYYSKKWYEYIGCTPEECIGHGWNLPLHPDDRQKAIDRWNHALRTGEPYEIEYRFRGRDGNYRWFLARALPVRGDAGQIIRWFGTCTDIDDMKRTQEALRTSEARYRSAEQELRTSRERLMAALSASNTGTFRWSPDTGDFLEFDDSLKQLFGLAPEDQVRTVDDFASHVHPDDRSQLIAAIDRCRDGADFEMEYRVVLSDGSVRWLYDRAKMVCDAEGQPAYLVGACIDITDRRKVEETLREADRRKDEFLASLAHELRNPLAPIRTGLELMKIAEHDPAMLRDVRRMMEEQTHHLVRLVDDLLDVSRITSGRIPLRISAVRLASVVENALDAARPLIEELEHELTVTLPQDDLLLEVDPTRLTQVLSNLLTNAAKYTDRGGRIQFTAQRRERELRIAVKDTGIGIPDDMLGRIFEAFIQVDGALGRSQPGLGIGLMLVKRLVEMHGGTVEAHSEGLGKGSEFTVRLPVVIDQVPQRQLPSGNADAGQRRLRILVVDDNRSATAMLGTMLETMGNEIRTAYDGVEAIEVAAQFQPELVLMDIGMPNLNGYDTAQRIREQPWGRDLTLVALTGWGQDEDRRRTKEAGFDHHFVKPIEPGALRKLLAECSQNAG